MSHVSTLIEPLKHLIEKLEVSGLTYAIGGAIALGYWGVPRSTLDIDMTLWFPTGKDHDAFETLFKLGVTGASLDRVVKDSVENGVVYLRFEGVRLDVFSPSIPFYDEALALRTRVSLPEVGETWMLSAETLAVFKLLFFRAKDLGDLERLRWLQNLEASLSLP